GLGYALASAALAAVFPVMNRRLVLSGGDPLTMVAWEMAGVLAVSLAVVISFGETASLFAWHRLDWLWLLVLALACTVFAHGFQIRLLKYLGAYTVNLAISFEPLYGILAAAWAFGEYKQLTPMFYVGLSAILLANVLHPLGVRMSRGRTVHPTADLQSSQEDNPVYPLWLSLSTARVSSDDLGAAPWNSRVPEVQQAWKDLTRPENLSGLKHWHGAPDQMNPVAREAARKALEACVARCSQLPHDDLSPDHP
ncbi:MAG: EamA family transporter, partial [Verrucomicrobiaceae bacterium]